MSDLRLDEADELLAAWVSARAENHGIRVLVIKGRPLADDGLRTARVSSDVDVLVEPARFEEYCALVLAAGWQEFPSTYAAAHFTVHSRTFRKPGCPNSLDVHSDFPGFLREPDVKFEALWATQRDTVFAHRACPVPSRADPHLQHPEVPDRLWPMLCARAARWGRGTARLRPAIRALRPR